MSTSNLDLSNVVEVSVATPPAGLANFEVNNLLIITSETPTSSPGVYGAYLSPTDVASDWGTNSHVYAQAVQIFSQSPNILAGGGTLYIAPLLSMEALGPAITRLSTAGFFFGGVMVAGYVPGSSEWITACGVAASLQRLLFVFDHVTSTLTSGGLFFQINELDNPYARMLLYTNSAALAQDNYVPAYVGRAMSVDFEGSATTITMHMKDLVGVAPDTGITQTVLTECESIGADVYCDIAGLSKVFSTGGNDYFDDIYNQMWLVYALQVAAFNVLATTSTKIPQTEPGMSMLKNAITQVLDEAVTNGYVAPGAWNSPELFGDPVALVRLVLQTGYYVYSQPVNQQSEASRIAREAPLIQIAIKLAGAIQSVSIVVNINP